ncbi:MAG: TatD family hydrolase [Endomicrobium sp.]|jgi:TatD DNase family protein|nr:TatD family hydrolase [Endomicrobium sp.]
MIIDTHMHLLDPKFNNDRDLVINKATQLGITKMIEVTCEENDWWKAIDLAKTNSNIFVALGIHPNNIDNCFFNTARYNCLQSLATYESCVAIGEIGLDYHHVDLCDEVIMKQKEVFQQQLDIAIKINKPVIIHCRDAYQDMLCILKKYSPPIKGVIHCFSGQLKYAEEFLKLGFYLGVDGPITYDYNYARRSIIYEVPTDNILIETDSPYLIPFKKKQNNTSLRHQHLYRNEPAYIIDIIKSLAQIKKTSFEIIENTTTNNAMELFKL